jgi:isoamylase
VNQLRARQKRNFMATLLFSQGVPMLLAGDEIGRTQAGNNNAYCQDNEISWLDWNPEHMDHEILAFVRQMIGLRKQHPVFQRRKFFQGRKIKGAEIKDIIWLRPDGGEMTDEEWNQDFARCLGVALSGAAIDEVDERGQGVQDENFLLLLNAHFEEIPFRLPAPPLGAGWIALIDSSCQLSGDTNRFFVGNASYPLKARSLALLVERASDRMRGPDRRRNPAA